jgi:hypothetical protein
MGFIQGMINKFREPQQVVVEVDTNEPTAKGFTSVEENFFGQGESEVHQSLETSFEQTGTLDIEGASDEEKVRYAQVKLEGIRTGLARGTMEGNDKIMDQIATLEQAWDQYGRKAADRLWSQLGEPEAEAPVVTEVPEVPGTEEAPTPEEEPKDYYGRLQEYLNLDLETRVLNDILAENNYATDSEAYQSWMEASDRQKEMWSTFSEQEQTELMDAGIHLKDGGNKLRELAGLKTYESKIAA